VLVVGILLLLKIVIPLIIGLLAGWLDSPRYLLYINYWPLLCLLGIIALFWGSLMRIVPTAAEAKRISA